MLQTISSRKCWFGFHYLIIFNTEVLHPNLVHSGVKQRNHHNGSDVCLKYAGNDASSWWNSRDTVISGDKTSTLFSYIHNPSILQVTAFLFIVWQLIHSPLSVIISTVGLLCITTFANVAKYIVRKKISQKLSVTRAHHSHN